MSGVASWREMGPARTSEVPSRPELLSRKRLFRHAIRVMASVVDCPYAAGILVGSVASSPAPLAAVSRA